MQLMWSKLLLVVPWALGLIPAQRNAPAPRVVRLRAAAVVETPAKELLATLTAPEPAARTEQLKNLIERTEATFEPRAFEEQNIKGSWRLRYQLDAKAATRSQKALAGFPADSDFINDESGRRVFRNVARLSSERVYVVADVAYEVGDLLPNRLVSDISAAGLYVHVGRRWNWKPLRIPLPIKGKGWLDVTYLDDSMRVTRGNRGGLFVHVRPELCP
mmetsp:Transcript_10518/g.31637  ORF Transcript_10518/g.31637 Transcript_10518/m.31637 type:complete len:217 (+) Transcript_10518:418-1068(+)